MTSTSNPGSGKALLRGLVPGLFLAFSLGCGSSGGEQVTTDEPEEIGDDAESGDTGTPGSDATGDGDGDTVDDAGDTSETCTTGATRCEDGGTLIVCGADGEEMIVRCAADEACGLSDGRADCIRVAECATGDRWCTDGATVRTCTDGEPVDEPCPVDEVCRAGACTAAGTCAGGSTRCRDAITLLACRDTVEEVIRCASDEVCTGQYPDADCENTGECPAGTAVCLDAARARVCENAAEGWREVTCETGETCLDGRCEREDTGPVCTPDDTRCHDGERQRCATDGQVWIGIPCESGLVCEGGECVEGPPPPICTPGDTRCDGTNTLETCSSEGDGWTPSTCGTGRSCLDGVCEDDGTPISCTPGTRRCVSSNSLEVCNEAGDAWTTGSCQSGTSCQEGLCVPDPICTPGTTRCAGTGTLETCSDNGDAWVPSACGTGRSCSDGTCVLDPICFPGATRCAGTATLETCSGDGSQWTPSACGTGRSCADGVCVDDGPPVICAPGATRCADDFTAETCSSDGTEWTGTSCSGGLVCEDGACVDPPVSCTPGERTCDGNSARVCGFDGSAWTTTPCGEHFCNDGLCRRSCQGATESNWGCRFHAIHLDQADTPCESTTDCSQLPGSTCQSNLCRYSSSSTERFALSITNVTDQSNTVTIRSANGTEIESLIIEPHAATFVRVPIPAGHRNGSRVGYEAFRVEATRAISVVQFGPPPHITRPIGGATALTPDDQLGREFDVLTWPSRVLDDTPHATWITIVAVENGTTVNVLPNAPITSGTGVPATSRFQSRDFTLQASQSVTLYAELPASDEDPEDLSATLLSSNRPVAVFAGSRCSTVPHGTEQCDHLEHQIPPVSRLGSQYIVTRTSALSQMPDVIRILNTDDRSLTAQIRTTPEIPGLHNRNVRYGHVIEAEVDASHFRIDAELEDGRPARVAVAQFSPGRYHPCTLNIVDVWSCPQSTWDNRCIHTPIGGPSFMHLLPTSSYARRHRIHIPPSTQEVNVDIVSPEGPLPRVNGTAVSAAHVGSSAWRTSRRALSSGTYLIEGDNPIGVHLHGKGCGSAYATMLGGGTP